MNQQSMDSELQNLDEWYCKESTKIWNLPLEGLDGNRDPYRKKLDKQFLKKREEILTKYAVAIN